PRDGDGKRSGHPRRTLYGHDPIIGTNPGPWYRGFGRRHLPCRAAAVAVQPSGRPRPDNRPMGRHADPPASIAGRNPAGAVTAAGIDAGAITFEGQLAR